MLFSWARPSISVQHTCYYPSEWSRTPIILKTILELPPAASPCGERSQLEIPSEATPCASKCLASQQHSRRSVSGILLLSPVHEDLVHCNERTRSFVGKGYCYPILKLLSLGHYPRGYREARHSKLPSYSTTGVPDWLAVTAKNRGCCRVALL